MIIKPIKQSYLSRKKIAIHIVEPEILCPVCHRTGKKVSNLTVEHLVKENLKSISKDDIYYLCMSEDCNIVYYNAKANITFTKEQINVPVWFKNDVNPKYICYCSKVTEEQIINAVLNEGAKNIKDIMRLTGAMKNAKCEFNNPLGKCCSSIIQQTINKALTDKTL